MHRRRRIFEALKPHADSASVQKNKYTYMYVHIKKNKNNAHRIIYYEATYNP
jgi:hypothetical protein